MAAHGDLLAPATVNRGDATLFSSVALSADTAPFFPSSYNGWRARPASDVEKQFFRSTERLRCLRPDSDRLREELNLLFDQLLSESYNFSNEPSTNIQPEVTHTSWGLVCPIVAVSLKPNRTSCGVGAVTWQPLASTQQERPSGTEFMSNT